MYIVASLCRLKKNNLKKKERETKRDGSILRIENPDDITFRRGNIKIQTNSQNSFRVGDVVELEFNGDVEGIISLTESVKWCKRTEGEFRPISLQDAPMITLVPIGGIYCSQISRIFYHIAQNDTDLEIMCDLDFWLKNKNRCAGGYNSPKLMINTSIEDNEWRISQIIIYDKFGVINPNNFSIEGTGRTIHLLCVASALSTTKAPVMNWCVRKKDHVTWSKIVLQEEEIKAFGNNSVEALKFSRITYHITQYDKVVQFLCEISASSLNSCGSGLNLVNVTISKNEDKIQERIDITETQEPIITSTTVLPLESTEHQGRTYITETQDPKITSTTVLPLESTEHQGISTVSVLAALSVLLFVLLTVIVLLVITACRRGKFTFLGFIIKIKREKKDTGDEKGNENKTDISLQKERRKNKDSSKINIGFERQSIYENEDLKNENDASTVKTDNESSKYEELKIRDNQQEYEELNL
ncbi:uncharacterized protein LOC134282163 [Saccostrea cucullata]|uniref:uncharacterized protein LOC134282163 n=1 Tax=Saccostrea cuccullata TaxID=36930 RepID=UPI002ED1DE81